MGLRRDGLRQPLNSGSFNYNQRESFFWYPRFGEKRTQTKKTWALAKLFEVCFFYPPQGLLRVLRVCCFSLPLPPLPSPPLLSPPLPLRFLRLFKGF